MKKPERWQSVLLALYAEALHCGDFSEVTRVSMGMESGEFSWTIYILQMRGLIEGCVFQPPKPSTSGRIMEMLRDGLMLTPKGFEYAETIVKTNDTDAALQMVWGMLRDVGAGLMANIVYGWIG